MSDWNGEQDYERFKEAVPASRPAVWAVAQHLQGKGSSVQVPRFSLCGSYEERNGGYGDTYDLGVVLPVEVKHHDFGFTCSADYPYSNIIVDRANKIERLGDSIVAYWQTNQSLSHALIIHRRTRQYWFKRKIKDSKKGFSFEVYMVPKEHAEFVALNQ